MTSIYMISYAVPSSGYVWKWSADFDAVEWHDGTTLAMWPEVHTILNSFEERNGLPCFGSLLFLLAACRDDWQKSRPMIHARIREIHGLAENDAIPPDLAKVLVNGLDVIHGLPVDLRGSLAAKCHLASAILEGGPHSISQDRSRAILDEFSISGARCLAGVSNEKSERKERLKRDIRSLEIGLARHDPASLESLLRTGLENTALAPAAIPEKAAETGDPKLLLDRLAAAGGESGAAAVVARRSIAMMNFPGHVGTPRDLPVGGIADITNRGTIDRLLPGELAWDDLVLAARLVHNEALYFRREIPPMNVAVAHTILLDRELRLWGTGRVLSLGVALGLWHHPALNGAGETFECVAATPDYFEYLELDTPQKIHAALETLVPASGPRGFLEKWWEAAQIVDDPALPDVSLIMDREHLADPDMRRLLGEVTVWIHGKGGHFRILALEHGGGLEVQSWTPGGNRTLFRGEIDLEEIIRDSKRGPGKQTVLVRRPMVEDNPLLAISSIYGWEHLPFLFPLVPQASAFLPDGEEGGGIGVAVKGQLMHWPKGAWGGVELHPKLPGRQHWVGRDERGSVIVIASGEKGGEAVRVFRWEKNRLEEIEVAASRHTFPRHAAVSGGAVVLGYSDRVEALSLSTGRRVAEEPVKALPTVPVFDFDGHSISVIDSGKKLSFGLEAWSFISDKSWPRLIVPEEVALGGGKLWVRCGKQEYSFNHVRTSWEEGKSSIAAFVPFQETALSPAKGMNLRKANLSERLVIWHDPRGMIHVMDTSAGPIATWSILLSAPACSIWSSSSELFSTDARLRSALDTSNGLQARRDLMLFLSELDSSSPRP